MQGFAIRYSRAEKSLRERKLNDWKSIGIVNKAPEVSLNSDSPGIEKVNVIVFGKLTSLQS